MLFEKTKNKWNQRPGWPIYRKVDLIAKHEIITLRLLFQNWSKKGFFIKNVDLMVDKSFWMKSPWKCWLMIASICFGKKLKSFFLLFFYLERRRRRFIWREDLRVPTFKRNTFFCSNVEKLDSINFYNLITSIFHWLCFWVKPSVCSYSALFNPVCFPSNRKTYHGWLLWKLPMKYLVPWMAFLMTR